MLLQRSTYVSVASGWSAVLRRAGTPRPLIALMRIAVTKLFADQAVPTAGLGGNILLVDQLRGLGVARGTAVAAVPLSMIGFYAAYALFAIMMLVLLSLDERATPIMAGMVTLMVAAAIPSLALWLRRCGRSRFPPHLARIGFVRSLLDAVAEAPGALLRDRALLVRVTVCNGLVFIADVGQRSLPPWCCASSFCGCLLCLACC